MSRQLKDLALLFAVCQIMIQQLSWTMSIDQSPVTIQTIEPKRNVKSTDTITSSNGNSYKNGSPEASSSVNHHQQQRSWVDSRRPVWNMAHMVNSIKELDYRLAKGANAIEVDVTFGRLGDPLYTYHGPPCDCWRHCHQQEDFNEFLRYVREISMEEPDGIGNNLSLVLLDLKLDPLDHKAKAKAGVELAKSVVENLFPTKDIINEHVNSSSTRGHQPTLSLILSVNHVTDIELIRHFLHQMEMTNSSGLLSKIGFDVGMNDDLQLIESMWRKFGNQLNLWQGDGYTNCFSPFYNLERLSKALQKRDQESGYPRKVYQWTIDLHDRMRESLRMGVDAVMTNHPERLLVVLQEPELAHNFRLATREDNPFKKIIYRASSRSGESARYQRSAGHSSGGLLAGLMDILSSWMNWIREIPYLSLPTTSRFLPSSPKRQKQAEKRIRPSLRNEPSAKSPDAALISTASSTVDSSISAKSSGGETTLATTTSLSDQNGDSTTNLTTTTSSQADNQTHPYEGPKWYTSLASNLLVSAMKVALPANS